MRVAVKLHRITQDVTNGIFVKASVLKQSFQIDSKSVQGMKKRRSKRRRAVKSSDSSLVAVGGVHEPLSDYVRDFSTLPESVLICILLKLDTEDISNCCCTCTTFVKLVSETEFWKHFCRFKWGSKTELESWVTRRRNHRLVIPNLPRPSSFKELSRVLSGLDGLIGVWQGSLNYSQLTKKLFTFSWGSDSLQCRKLGDLEFSNCFSIGPHHYFTAEVVDGCHCILKDYTKSLTYYQNGWSSDAIDAASVALGPLAELDLIEDDDDNAMMSFSNPLQEFFLSKVYCKRRSEYTHRDPHRLVPNIFHLTRVEVPIWTPKRWLAGIWTSLHTDHVEEFLTIDYPRPGQCSIIVEFLNGVLLPSGEFLRGFTIEDENIEGEMKERGSVIKGYGQIEVGRKRVECFLEIISEDCICFSSEEIDLFRNGKSMYKRIAEHENNVLC
eukprot:g575.t1